MGSALDAALARKRELTQQTHDAAVAQLAKIQSIPDGAIEIYTDKKDGRVYQTPDGMLHYTSPSFSTENQEDIISMIGGEGIGRTAGDISRSGFDRDIVSQHPVASAAASAIKGVPFIGEFADEATGMMFGEEAMTGQRSAAAAFQREKPKTALGLQVGAGIASAVPFAPGTAIKGGSMAAKMAKGATIGAGIGAAEGAVSFAGREHGGDRLGAAKEGAVYGGAVGLLVGLGMPLAAAGMVGTKKGFVDFWGAIRKDGVNKTAKDLGISPDALRRINDAIEADGGPEVLFRRLEDQGELGSIGSAGGPNTRALLDEIVVSPGAGATAVTKATGRQTSDAYSTTIDMMDAVLQKPQFRSVIKDHMDATSKKEIAAHYRAAGRQVVNPSDPKGVAVFSALSRIPKKKLKEAIRLAEESMTFDQIKFNPVSIGKKGKIKGDITIGHLNEIKKAFQEIAYSPTNFDVMTGSMTPQGRMAARSAALIKDVAVEYSPLYRTALKRAADQKSKDAAYKIGSNILSPKWTKEDAFRVLGQLDGSERAHAVQGVRNYIDNMLGEVKTFISSASADGAESAMDAKQLNEIFKRFSSKNTRLKLEQLVGGPDAAALIQHVEKAGIVANLRMQVAIGSKTGLRSGARGATAAIVDPNAFGKAIRGEGIQATKRITQSLTGTTPADDAARLAGYYADVADVLATLRGPEAKKALSVFINRKISKKLTPIQAGWVIDALVKGGVISGYTAAQGGISRVLDENDRQNRVRRGDRAGVTGLSDADLDAAIREAQNGP